MCTPCVTHITKVCLSIFNPFNSQYQWSIKQQNTFSIEQMSHDHHDHDCGCHSVNSSTIQTLDELEFERGIWSAALNNEVKRVKKCLSDARDPDQRDSSGYTALHYAARNGHLEIVELLLNEGADINAATRSGGSTALHRAALAGHLIVVKLLLDRGADVTLRDNDGKTALDKAKEAGKDSISVLLAQHRDANTTTTLLNT